ncbi:MAG: hydrogenase large subunit [Thermoplasmatales archaeon]|nr:hydrogenase large subunit [Thermoplasmatales archaeon]
MRLGDPIACDPALLAQYVKAYCDEGWRVVSMFASESSPGSTVNVLLRRGGEVARVASETVGSYPAVSALVPAASVFERAMWEMSGVVPEGHGYLVPAIYWRKGDGHPLQKAPYSIDGEERVPLPNNPIRGAGLFEIPVGPVHAGVIEPGHFRFSVAGEPILEMRVHLGYAHKGIEKMMEGPVSRNRAHLAERISGDNAVAHSLACAHIVEGDAPVPRRARQIRVILSEIERIHNHLDVLAGLCTDCAFSVAAAYGSEVRERLLRANREIFGNRLLMGNVVPGGVRNDLSREDVSKLEAAVMHAGFGAKKLEGYIRRTPSVVDRLETTGVLRTEDALRYGTVGVVARASGVASDVRAELPYEEYGALSFNPVSLKKGDVMSRAAVRADEIVESVSLILQCTSEMEEGEIRRGYETPDGLSCGIVESPRGELVHCADVRDGEVWRYSIRDPSFVNWPAMEVAVLDNIVPDFPLINKSFGLSYSGNDV